MGTILQRYGPWAVITGASSGIGAEFARQLAAHKLSIVLVARREAQLQEISDAIRREHDVETRVIPADLTTEQGCTAVVSGTADVDVGLLVNNAGMELHGSFLNKPASTHMTLIALNVTALTTLTHAFGKRLVARRKGGIIQVSSTAKDGLSYMSTYSASKAFVSNLAVILREEMREFGVDVLSFEPGGVDTGKPEGDFHKMGWPFSHVSDVVRQALDALVERKLRITPNEAANPAADRAVEDSLTSLGAQMKEVWDASLFEPKL